MSLKRSFEKALFLLATCSNLVFILDRFRYSGGGRDLDVQHVQFNIFT